MDGCFLYVIKSGFTNTRSCNDFFWFFTDPINKMVRRYGEVVITGFDVIVLITTIHCFQRFQYMHQEIILNKGYWNKNYLTLEKKTSKNKNSISG
jgi:hypothetical protein